MKIVYLALKGMPLGGGIENYTENIGSRMVSDGHEVIVYTMKHYDAIDGYYKGMKIITVPSINSKFFEKLSATISAIFLSLREESVDIYHIHSFGPGFFSFIYRLLGKKVVVQGHGIEWKRSKWNFLGKFFLQFTEIGSVLFPNKLTAVSKVQVDYIKKKYNRICTKIPTGVNNQVIKPPNKILKKYSLEGDDYILFAARLVKEKGAHYLIKAYNMLSTDKKLVIAGDAKYEEKYIKSLKEMSDNNDNIIFTGFVQGELLQELFSNCYFFVLPSEIEGLPTALLEAMSYKNCCLASDIPENLEALGNNGYTFVNKDINDLSKSMKELIDDSNKVNQIKKDAYSYVLENHHWDNITRSFLSFYK